MCHSQVDHPRIRGEHSARRPPAPRSPGSSPHTRGALRQRALVFPSLRIIPAYAGSTVAQIPGKIVKADHPRIRGEHWIVPSSSMCRLGSSPHTRGALPESETRPPESRIIPAYAGSTILIAAAVPGAPDHPRIRGEHGSPPLSTTGIVGSSPHTRGAHWHHATPSAAFGIIPAYAGSTRRLSGRRRGPADHPRIRGEH